MVWMWPLRSGQGGRKSFPSRQAHAGAICQRRGDALARLLGHAPAPVRSWPAPARGNALRHPSAARPAGAGNCRTKLSPSRKPASITRRPSRAKRSATGCTGTSASSAAWKMRAWNTREHAVVAAAAFGKHRHRTPRAQPLDHRLHHRGQRMVAAAAMEDGAPAGGQPADQRPAGDLRLGHETGGALAVQQLDVEPRGVVGDEQHRVGQRLRRSAPRASRRCASARSTTSGSSAMRERFAAVAHHPSLVPAQHQRGQQDRQHACAAAAAAPATGSAAGAADRVRQRWWMSMLISQSV